MGSLEDDDLIVILDEDAELGPAEDGRAVAPLRSQLRGDRIGTPESRASSPPTAARVKVLWRRARRLAASLAAVVALSILLSVVLFTLRRDYVAAYYPSPGKLSAPHSRVLSKSPDGGCRSCHEWAGVSSGCLSCHEEIAGQLARGEGYHPFLFAGEDPDCAFCHREHRGEDARLIDAHAWRTVDLESFWHPHVEFHLEGRHRELECQACHQEKVREPFALSRFPEHPRAHSFLGLEQECSFCHEDPHAGGLSDDCESCHGQDSFRPAGHFDHSEHFALEGGHEQLECKLCHEIPPLGAAGGETVLPFAEVRGTQCHECHDSPHRTAFGVECESCHAAVAAWHSGREAMTVELHGLTGFLLTPQHTKVDCAKCHPRELPYAERFPDPAVPGYLRIEDSCQGCHLEAHGGQFLQKGWTCLDCHDRRQFRPHHFADERHAEVYPLVGAHAGADCEGCHLEDPASGVRIFVGTSRACQSCHQSPHGGQFENEIGRCADCHSPKTFVPARFDLARHETVFPLEGSHRAVPCVTCHVRDGDDSSRRFVGLSHDCKGCHQSPHGDQFAPELARGDCTGCHSGNSDTFSIRPFDHEKSAGYALVGGHARADCNDCHFETEVRPHAGAERVTTRRYRGISTECSTCHRDIHRGQFRDKRETDCGRCHVSTTEWSDLEFDHKESSRFALDGKHAEVRCRQCHVATKLADGSDFIQFKPLGTECHDCHTIDPR